MQERVKGTKVDLHKAISLQSIYGVTSMIGINSCGLNRMVTRRKRRSSTIYHCSARIVSLTRTLSKFTRRKSMRFLVHKHTRQTLSGSTMEGSVNSFLQIESLILKKSFKVRKGQRLLAPTITRRNTATQVRRSEY